MAEPLPDYAVLALGHAKGRVRLMLADLFALDALCARSVDQASEPILAQLRLAWWREQWAGPTGAGDDRDPLLLSLRESWHGARSAITDLIDAWELVATGGNADAFIAARAACFAAVAEAAGCPGPDAHRAGLLWGEAELARRGPQAPIDRSDPRYAPLRLPRRLRALALVGGLARRALLRGRGEPLLGDRLSPLAAARLGILGR